MVRGLKSTLMAMPSMKSVRVPARRPATELGGYARKAAKRLLVRTVGSAFRTAIAPDLRRIDRELRRLHEAIHQQAQEAAATEERSGEGVTLTQVTNRALAEEMTRRLRRADSRTGPQLADFLRGIPDQYLIRFYSQYDLTGTMDYGRHEIRLRRTSDSIRYRLNATKKEPLTVEWIEQNVKSGDVFYDIGANVGSFSLIAAKFTENQAKVFAFEPAFATFADLCWNVMFNHCQNSIVPLPLALGSKNTLSAFEYRSIDSGASRHRLEAVGGPFKARHRQTVLTYRLDDLVREFGLPTPNLIKLDVDGPELAVLQGAQTVLRGPACRSLIVELTEDGDTIRQFMESVGFRLEAEHDRGKKTPYQVFKKVQAGGSDADLTSPVNR